MTCKWFSVCPVREMYEKGMIEEKWILNYCKSKQNYKNCKRYQLEEKGIPHADNMLPDGSYV